MHGNDRRGLERLCRYGLRPALSVERLTEAADGHVVYEMKRTFSDGTRCQRFTPREFLLRLCALVPPPGFHMVRYAGIFSGHARGRYALTGRGLRDGQPGRPPRDPGAHVLLPPNKLLPAGSRARTLDERLASLLAIDLLGPAWARLSKVRRSQSLPRFKQLTPRQHCAPPAAGGPRGDPACSAAIVRSPRSVILR